MEKDIIVDVMVENKAPEVDVKVANRAGGMNEVLHDETLIGNGADKPLGVNPERIPDVSNLVSRDEFDMVTSEIQSVIPTTAYPGNPLADQGFVNSSIQTSTAHFRGDWATWADVPTDPTLYPADAQGNRAPTPNDYLVIIADELHDGGTWRYKYTGLWSEQGKDGWQAEYQVNETPLTAAQLAALNSGITAEDVASFVKNTDYASASNAGVVKLNTAYGIGAAGGGVITTIKATNDDIDKKTSSYRVIVPNNLDYAVKTSVTTNTIELTDDEKAAVRTWLAAVGTTEYATDGKVGVIKGSGVSGLYCNSSGNLVASTASLSAYTSKPVTYTIGKGTLENIKYDLVKQGITANTITLTNEEKAAAQAWLGIDTLIGDIETALAGV